jgi:ATP-binding cassette subfamily B protein
VSAAVAVDTGAPAIPGRGGAGWLSRHPLIRCLVIYRQIPARFCLCLALFIGVNLGLAAWQHLVGRAVNDLQNGRAVVRLADGRLDLRPALVWVAILVGVAAARAVLQYGAALLSLTIGQDLLSRLRVAILIQVQRLDLAYHLRHGIGEMVTRTTRDADKVRDALISVWRNVVETSLVIAGAIGLIAWYAPALAAGPVVATALGLGWLVRQVDKLVLLDRNVGAAFDAVNQDLTEGVHGVRVIKAFGLETSRIARFEASVAGFVAAARRALAFASTHIPVPQVIVALSQVWVLVLGARLVAAGRLDIGGLVASLLMMNTVVFRVEAIGRVMQTFADARASAARIMELLDAEPLIVNGRAPLPSGPLGVALRGIRVKSPGGETDVLADCALTIAPGEVVALVGATGSGKTTLTSLIPRLVDADAGEVRIGSDAGGWRAVRDLDLAPLRRRVQVVPQDLFLFSDTVAANIRMGSPDATEADVWQALRAAAADDFVAALPDGLHTVIGDRGVTLSGGQRQRLALARALAARPSVLILDDATSALDAVTEQTILDGLRASVGPGSTPVTILIVASKLSTVLLAERALLLEDGRIAAAGRHENLARAEPSYRELLGVDEHGRTS